MLEMANLLLVVSSLYVMIRCVIAIIYLYSTTPTGAWHTVIVLALLTLTLCLVLIDSSLNLFWVNLVPFRLFAHVCDLTGSARLLYFSCVTQIMVQVTMVVVAAQVCLILAQSTLTPAELAAAMDELRILLYHAAAVLVIYSVEAATEMLWPASCLPPGPARS